MNNAYFEKLTQKIKAYIRYRDPTAPSYLDGGFSNSTFNELEDIDGGVANSVYQEDEIEMLDGGLSNSDFNTIIDCETARDKSEITELFDGGIAHDGNADDSDEFRYIHSYTDLQEVEINDNLEKLFGCFNAKTARIKLLNPISSGGTFRYYLEDKDIEIFFGFEENGEIKYTKKGTYRVKKENKKTVTGNTEFNLQDLSYVFDQKCDIDFHYPLTRKQIVEMVCNKLNIRLATPDFWCSGMSVDSQFYVDGSTYRDIIRIVAESCLSNAKLGDDDCLYIKFYNYTDYKLRPRVYKSLNIGNKISYINRVALCETDESGSTDYDVIIAEDVASIEENGLSEVKISNNLILNADRERFAPLILGELSNFYYYGFSSEMVLGNFNLDHSIIGLIDLDGNEKQGIIMNINYVFNGAFKSKISATAESKTQQEYKGAGKVGELIKNTMLNVDKVKGLITSLNEEISGEDGLNSRLTKIEQSSTTVTTTIQESGSDNLIKNSVGYAWDNDNPNKPKFWELDSGAASYIENDWTRINSLSGRAWLFRTGVIEQEIAVTTGKTYTISFIARKISALGRASVIVENGAQTVVYDHTMENDEYSYTFKAKGNSIKVIISATSTEIYITDLLLNTGDTKQQWKQASGELYTSEVLVDIDGVLIRNSLYSGYTVISPSEFAGYYKVGSRYIRVFTLNKDTTEVTKIQIDESAEFGTDENEVTVKFIAVYEGLDIVVVDKEAV